MGRLFPDAFSDFYRFINLPSPLSNQGSLYDTHPYCLWGPLPLPPVYFFLQVTRCWFGDASKGRGELLVCPRWRRQKSGGQSLAPPGFLHALPHPVLLGACVSRAAILAAIIVLAFIVACLLTDLKLGTYSAPQKRVPSSAGASRLKPLHGRRSPAPSLFMLLRERDKEVGLFA